MKKKTVLAIVVAVAAIVLIAIITIAVNKRHKGTGPDNPDITSGPDNVTPAVIVEEKSEPLKVEDELYPFTLIPNDDGTLTVSMDGTIPAGYEWSEADMMSDVYISVKKTSDKTYLVSGNTVGGESFKLPLKKTDGLNEIIAEIRLDVEIGRNNEYTQIGSMTEVIEGITYTIPILDPNGETGKGISVLYYNIEKYDIPAEGESILKSRSGDFYPYQIKVMDNGKKYEIKLDAANKDWYYEGLSSYITLEGPAEKDGYIVSVITVLPKEIEEEEEYEDEVEPDGEYEVKPRFVTFALFNDELNVHFELTLNANDDGTSEVYTYGTDMYVYADIQTYDDTSEESSDETSDDTSEGTSDETSSDISDETQEESNKNSSGATTKN